MAPSESFDPRTWQARGSASASKLVTALKPAAAAPVAMANSASSHRWWLGPALSLAILAGGALAAYETRGDAPAAQAAASNQ